MKLRPVGWSLLGLGAVAIGAALVSSTLNAKRTDAASSFRPGPSGQPAYARSAASEEPPAPSAPSRSVPSASAPASVIPDLVQSDPALGFPLEGSSHCGPVAASDILMDLARRGWPALAPEGTTEKERHVALAAALATRGFMDTSPFGGTPPTGILLGLDRWVSRAGYRVRSLAYQGWRNHPARFGVGVRTPDPAWMREAFEHGGTALIHVGWYRYQPWDGGFVRHGGHWLAVASVSAEGDPPEMVLADPAPYAGAEPHDEIATLTRIDRGYLKEGSITLAARGFYKVGGGLNVKRAGEIAILDGAIALVLERP